MINKNFIELVDIESIETIGEQNVVDISIADHNSFMLSNGLIVHNSAKSSCIAGFSSVGRDYYGAFPLKGKILNVRDTPTIKVKENDEISKICTILGLSPGLHYPNKEGLRYGKVVFMTDADCWEEGTLVKTTNGPRKIEDIQIGELVYTHRGVEPVVNRWERVSDTTISFTIDNIIFTCSETHKIPVLRNGEVQVILAKDLKETDQILKRK